MENFSKNNLEDENEESKKIVDNFKNELEKIKQKLGKNYTTQPQTKKENNITNFHYINNQKMEPKEEKLIEKENNTKQNTSIFSKVPSYEELKMKYGISINNKPNSIKEITLETNMNKFNKNKEIQLLTEINSNKINENFSQINNKKILTEENEKNIMKKKDINDINNKINDDNNIKNIKDDKNLEIFNSNKNLDKNSNVNNKYELINLLNLKKDTEDEIKNIFNKKEL